MDTQSPAASPTPSRSRRLARVARWAGLVLCIAIGVGWWCSRVWTVDVGVTRSCSISLSRSAVRLEYADIALLKARGTHFGPLRSWPNVTVFKPLDPGRDVWQPVYMPLGIPPTSRTLLIPLWMVLALAMVPTGLLWRAEINAARRRKMVGHCESCGYDLTGLNPHAACPECGSSRRVG